MYEGDHKWQMIIYYRIIHRIKKYIFSLLCRI